jgi:predicted lipoprotein with Yx(FWY)xxD motif
MKSSWKHLNRLSALTLTVVAAGLAAVLLVGAALATTFTLQVAKQAKVTSATGSTTTENIVVNSRGKAVYWLSGDTKSHPKCTKANRCFHFWPPVTVSMSTPTKASGVSGALSVWHRNGFSQVVLAGHPLYTYAGDSARQEATGQGARGFGGTWYVIKASGSSGSSGGGSGGGGWG